MTARRSAKRGRAASATAAAQLPGRGAGLMEAPRSRQRAATNEWAEDRGCAASSVAGKQMSPRGLRSRPPGKATSTDDRVRTPDEHIAVGARPSGRPVSDRRAP
jgi:hypothetical protein